MNARPAGTNAAPSYERPPAPPAPPATHCVERPVAVIDRMRYEAAKAALQGLLAANPATTQHTSNADIYATRAVRYADALLAALNQSTAEAIHVRDR